MGDGSYSVPLPTQTAGGITIASWAGDYWCTNAFLTCSSNSMTINTTTFTWQSPTVVALTATDMNGSNLQYTLKVYFYCVRSVNCLKSLVNPLEIVYENGAPLSLGCELELGVAQGCGYLTASYSCKD
jgi:hypothetical protein